MGASGSVCNDCAANASSTKASSATVSNDHHGQICVVAERDADHHEQICVVAEGDAVQKTDHAALPASGSTLRRAILLENALIPDSEIMRGISLRDCLQNFGQLWRKSPADLPEEQRAILWQRSTQVKSFDTFLSHTWHTQGRSKFLALSLQFGWVHILLAWLSAMVVVESLVVLDILPAYGEIQAYWHTALVFVAVISVTLVGVGIAGRAYVTSLSASVIWFACSAAVLSLLHGGWARACRRCKFLTFGTLGASEPVTSKSDNAEQG